MRVMLINPKYERYTRSLCPPLGILSIGTYLEANGHEVKVLNRAVKATDITKEFDSFKPDIIGCSFLSVMPFNDGIMISKEAKKRNILVVWGGPFVTSVPKLVLDLPFVDLLSMGEGEETWLELANTYKTGDIFSIKGIAYKKDGEIVITPERPFTDLSILPNINYELIDIEKTYEKRYDYDRCFAMYLSKGCTGHCTFCYNTDFHHNCRRQRPISQFLEEAKYMKEKHGINAIMFSDELFCKDKNNLHEVCNAIIDSGLDLKWGCMSKIGICDKEEYQLMFDAGCRWIEFGIESGAKSVLKRMKKGMNVERVPYEIACCQEIGIVTLCYIIVGFPDETEEELRETCDLLNRIKSTRVVCSYFNPLPGSEIYNKLVSEGKFTPPDKLQAYINPPIFYSPKPNLSRIPSKDLKVIRSTLLINSFFQKNFSTSQKQKFSLAIGDVKAAIKNVKKDTVSATLKQFFISGYEFLDMLFYAKCFPLTLKKYGLHKN